MEDYADAAQRHFDDAKLLHTQVPSRLANASHLYGFAAECALKSIIRKAVPNAVFRGVNGHVPNIFKEFTIHSQGSGNAALLRDVQICEAGLQNWKVEQRYHKLTTFQVQIVNAEAVSAEKLLALSRDHLRKVI